MEFMEEYTDINNQYKDEISALRIFMFRRYVEPTIVEEEAFAQFQGVVLKLIFNCFNSKSN